MTGPSAERARLLQAAVDGAPTLTAVVDAMGTVTYCSDAVVRLFGYQPEELVGTNILDYIDASWDELALVSVASAFEAEGLRRPMLFRLRHKAGHHHIVEATANTRFHDPDVEGMVVYVRRWDEQRLLDEILEGLAANDPLEQKLRLFVRVVGAETLDGVGAVLHHPIDGRFREVVADESLPAVLGADPTCGPDGAPWVVALETGDEQLVPVADLPVPLREEAERRGFDWCWAFPVDDSSGQRVACLVVWRAGDGMEESFRASTDRLTRLTRLVMEQEAQREQLEHAATHDPLTGLANRARFFGRFQDVLDGLELDPYADASSQGGRGLVGVAYLDLDGFKPVNDQLGHGAGDTVLVEIGRRLRAVVRSHDLVARMGGDEFAVLVAGVADAAELEALAERLSSVVREPIRIGDRDVSVGASVGLSIARPGSCSIDALVEAADAALYDAKVNDTGRWRVRALST